MSPRVPWHDDPLTVGRRRACGRCPICGAGGHARVAHERVVSGGGRHAAHAPSSAGIAIKVANAVDEDVMSSTRLAFRQAVAIVAIREDRMRLVAPGSDVRVGAWVTDDVDLTRLDACTRSKRIPVIIKANSSRSVGNRRESVCQCAANRIAVG